jgi:hypothetical protein
MSSLLAAGTLKAFIQEESSGLLRPGRRDAETLRCNPPYIRYLIHRACALKRVKVNDSSGEERRAYRGKPIWTH